MKRKQTTWTRLLCVLLVAILSCSCMVGLHVSGLETEETTPTTAETELWGPIPDQLLIDEETLGDIYQSLGMVIKTRASQGSIPDAMWNNSVLDALQWLGYNVNAQKNAGKLYDSYYTTQYTYANAAYGSGIPYDSVGNSTGCETVSSSSSPTGKIPNLTKFKNYGLCCASFASYYLINYLPNVEGTNAAFASALYTAITTNGYYHNPQSAYAWYYGLQKMVKDGTSIGGQTVQKYTTAQRDAALKVMQPGDVIIFTSNNNGTIKYNHVAIYIGQNADGKHWMANVSNDKGPGLDILEVYEKYYDGKGGDAIFYHLPLVAPQGFIEINKKDADNKALSGAEFQAVNNSTGTKYAIGPTNASGYAISEGLPVGTYTVTETKFPSGYTSSGTSSWTVSVTNGAKATVNAVNKLINGYIQVYKKDTGGSNLSGAKFKAVNNSTKAEYTIGPTNSSGYAKSSAIPTGTYTVTESTFPTGYTVSGTSSWTVTVGEGSSNNIATINAVNRFMQGYIEVYKKSTGGAALSGASFKAVNTSTKAEYTIGPTNNSGYAKSAALPIGTYTVTETVFPSGYTCSDTSSWSISVTDGKTATINAVNKPLTGNLKIVKTTNTGIDLSGWQFEVCTDAAMTQKISGSPFTTGSDGIITVTNLTPGTYYVQELEYDDPYWKCDLSVKSAEVTSSNTAQVTIHNIHQADIQIRKFVNSGDSREGFMFNIYDSNGQLTAGSPYTTSKTGVIYSEMLLPGEYTVEEILPDGSIYYCMDQLVQTTTPQAGETILVVYNNAVHPATILLEKNDVYGNPIRGGKFLLEWSSDGETWTPVSYSAYVTKGGCSNQNLEEGTLVSDGFGEVQWNGLYPTLQYRITEVDAPDGYSLLESHAYVGTIPSESRFLHIDVRDTSTYTLPHTGSYDLRIVSAGIFMSASALIGTSCYIRRKEH